MAAGEVRIDIVAKAHEQIQAELRKAEAELGRMRGTLASLSSQQERSTGVTKQAITSVQFLTSALGAAAVLGVGRLVGSLGDFVVAGEKSANTATSFARIMGEDATRALESAREATAGLVDATDLQAMISKYTRLGVTIEEQGRLFRLATLAALDQGRTVEDVLGVVESALKGRVTALVDLGVGVEKVGTDFEGAERGAEALRRTLDALDAQFGTQRLEDYKIGVQQARTAWGYLVNELQEAAAAFVVGATSGRDKRFQYLDEARAVLALTDGIRVNEESVRAQVEALQELPGILGRVTFDVLSQSEAYRTLTDEVAAVNAAQEEQLDWAREVARQEALQETPEERVSPAMAADLEEPKGRRGGGGRVMAQAELNRLLKEAESLHRDEMVAAIDAARAFESGLRIETLRLEALDEANAARRVALGLEADLLVIEEARASGAITDGEAALRAKQAEADAEGAIIDGLTEAEQKERARRRAQVAAGLAGAEAGKQILALFIRDKQVEAGIEAALETARSIAAFAEGNVPGGIAHAAAALEFGAVAAGAVGGGGGGGGGGGAGGGNGGGGSGAGNWGGGGEGGGQVVIQFGNGIVLGRPQEVAGAVKAALGSHKGTGLGSGAF